MPCWVIKVFSAPVSEFCGYPKSRISANTHTDINDSLFWNETLNASRTVLNTLSPGFIYFFSCWTRFPGQLMVSDAPSADDCQESMPFRGGWVWFEVMRLTQAHGGSDRTEAEQCLTIQQLVDQHKVVLDILLADLPKVSRHDVTHLVEELEHHGGVDVLLGDSSQPDVGALDVEEAGAGDVVDRGAHLLTGVDHVHAERVHSIASVEEEKNGRDKRVTICQ